MIVFKKIITIHKAALKFIDNSFLPLLDLIKFTEHDATTVSREFLL